MIKLNDEKLNETVFIRNLKKLLKKKFKYNKYLFQRMIFYKAI